jgi:hypothetical protein
MNVAYKILILIVSLLIAGLIGFLIGKYCFQPEPEVKTVTVTKYLKGDTIEVIKEKPVPYAVHDTVIEPVDTAQLYEVWKEHHKTNKYALDFSNDTIGTFTVDATVYQNQLTEAKANIVPIIKTVETATTEVVDNVKFIQGFVSIGTSVNNFNTQQVTAGVEFIEKYDVSATAIRYNSNFTYTINFGIKFGGK